MRRRATDELLPSIDEIMSNADFKFLDLYKISQADILGRGAHGEVRKCVRTSDNKQFAVKIVNKKKLKKANELRLQKEINILQILNTFSEYERKSFIQLVDTFHEKNTSYIVLELCYGTLEQFLDNIHPVLGKNETLENWTKMLFFQIVRGVNILHTNNIVHRDLKTKNLLFSNKKKTNIIIADFDVSFSFAAGGDQMETYIGTPLYMAPEIFQRESNNYDKLVDWWSCGVILYRCLSNEYPFDSPNGFAVVNKIVNDKVSFKSNKWKNVSREAKDLICHLLEKNPKKRYGYSQIQNHPWMKSLVSSLPTCA